MILRDLVRQNTSFVGIEPVTSRFKLQRYTTKFERAKILLLGILAIAFFHQMCHQGHISVSRELENELYTVPLASCENDFLQRLVNAESEE